MEKPSYDQSWEFLLKHRAELEDKRADLEAQLSEIRNELTHLNHAVHHLGSAAGRIYKPGLIDGLGITDAIRTILRGSGKERVSPTDLHQTLKAKRFDFSGYTQPMASIYKILTRLKDNGEIELEKEDHKVFYKWKEPDEDIPF